MDLLRFELADELEHRVPVTDFAIALLDDDYPPVTAVLFDDNGTLKQIDWDQVTALDTHGRLIYVSDLGKAVDAQESKDVLLRRDILDSLVLDLLGRRTTRVCDLLLEPTNGSIRLKRADTGMLAMLRRVTRGRFFRPDPESMFDWKYVEFLRGDPHAVDNGAGYRLRINRLPAGEIARLADYVPYLHAAELLRLLPDAKAAGVLEATSIERQVQMIEELSDKETVDLICKMSADLATDLVGRLEMTKMRRCIALMPEKCRNQIVELLRYPEDSVGGAMTNDIIRLPLNVTCEDAQTTVQKNADEVRFTSVIFVVDEDRQLRGSINLRELLAADGAQTLEELMDPYMQTLGAFQNSVEAAYRIVSGQLPAMPVIDASGRLIGAMTVEAAIARLVPATSGLQNLRVFA